MRRLTGNTWNSHLLYRNIGVLFFLLLTIVPMGLGLLYAFLYSVGITGSLNNGFTWMHWQAIWSTGSFVNSLWTSLWVATVSLSLSTFVALGVSLYLFGGVSKGPRQSSSIFYLPLSIPALLAAFLTFQFLGSSGILARVFVRLGVVANIESFPSLVNDSCAIGIIVTQVLMTFPFLTLLFASLYQSNQLGALGQVAKTLGASVRQIRLRVTVPILLKEAKPNLILFFIILMSSYEIPLLLGRQSPMMISVLIGQKFKKFNLSDLPQAYAMTVIYAIFMLILVAFALKTTHKSIPNKEA